MIQQRLRFIKRISRWAKLPGLIVQRLHVPQRFRATSSCTISFVVHLSVILLLAVTVMLSEKEPPKHVLTVETFVETIEPAPEWIQAAGDAEDVPSNMDVAIHDFTLDAQEMIAPEIPSPLSAPIAGEAAITEAAAEARRFMPRDLLLKSGAPMGGGYEGRNQQARSILAKQRGGTAESEAAVGRALAWLAAHQRENGSWRFDHRCDTCPGLCANPGTAGATTGATGLALLPFLGAGEIGEGSRYKDTVDKGLYYLSGRLIVTHRGGDLQEGSMYAHGIATLALCEAFAMTNDTSLRPVAQQAIDFIVNVQHERGGWRYFPGQPGDTTVFGWQFMALKSARMGGLRVSAESIHKAKLFLDSVQTEKGAYYGYLTPGKLPTPTAVGLLSRMYTGWYQDDPHLAAGVAYLRKLGPSRTDMYFNYYATQVLHHYAGDGWTAWNERMRERLIATQSRRGHEHGSWFFNDEHGDAGGRLYTTAMCCMILEVYYRHMPLYGHRSVEDGL